MISLFVSSMKVLVEHVKAIFERFILVTIRPEKLMFKIKTTCSKTSRLKKCMCNFNRLMQILNSKIWRQKIVCERRRVFDDAFLKLPKFRIQMQIFFSNI